MSNQKPSLVAVLAGVVVGVAVFVGVNVTTGRAIVPTVQSAPSGVDDNETPGRIQDDAVPVGLMPLLEGAGDQMIGLGMYLPAASREQ